MTNKLISIKKAAEILAVSCETLRNWEKLDKIVPVYTAGGHRRYKLSDIECMSSTDIVIEKETNRAAIYARVSTSDQKKHGDLQRQIGRLSEEAVKRGYNIVSIFEEVASGMNDKRSKLHKLMDLAVERKIDIVLIEHKDRLTRFMFEYLVKFFSSYDVVIVWTDDVLVNKSFEQELTEDILSLMATFSARIYSKRAKENRKKKQQNEVP